VPVVKRYKLQTDRLIDFKLGEIIPVRSTSCMIHVQDHQVK